MLDYCKVQGLTFVLMVSGMIHARVVSAIRSHKKTPG